MLLQLEVKTYKLGISQPKCYVMSLARSTECDKLQVDQKDCASSENV